MTWVWVVLVGTIGSVCWALAALQVGRGAITKRLRSGSPTIADRASVTITGTIHAVGSALLEAPLSGRAGVAVYACAELPEMEDRPEMPENKTLVTKRMIPFELETPSGRVFVDGEDLDVEMAAQEVATRSIERERAFMVAHGRGAEAAAVATFRELVLTPGMRVAVHGMAILDTSDLGAERGYRDAPPTTTRLVAPPSYPITIGWPRS